MPGTLRPRRGVGKLRGVPSPPRPPSNAAPSASSAERAPAEIGNDAGQAERRTIAGRAGIVAAGTLSSRLLGLVREQVLAAVFTRAATDVFFVAFLIPNVLRQLVAEGAVQNGVLPVLTEVRQKQGEARARSFFRALRGLSLALLLVLSLLGVVAAPALVALFAGGYGDTPGLLERTVTVTRWIFPYIFFMGTAALGVAALNTHRRFVVTSFAPALLNVAFIACALALPAWFIGRGLDPLYALCAGVLLGGVLQVVAQWPSLRAIGYFERPRFDLGDRQVREVLRRMLPVLFGFGVYYVDVVVARHMLSEEGVGAQSYFGFAMRLCDFPQGIFVMAVQTATLPSLALLASSHQHRELVHTFSHGLRLASFVAIPASCLFVALAEPIVRLVFERGHFDATATTETARALVAQGAGIWAVAAVRQLVIVFYALGDTRSPVFVAALDFAVFLTFALILRQTMGHVGIGWAVSLSSLAQMGMLGFLLRRRLGQLDGRRIADSLARTVAASLASAVVATAAARWLASVAPETALGALLPGGVGCLVFGAVYLMAAALLRCPELSELTGPIRRRFSS